LKLLFDLQEQLPDTLHNSLNTPNYSGFTSRRQANKLWSSRFVRHDLWPVLGRDRSCTTQSSTKQFALSHASKPLASKISILCVAPPLKIWLQVELVQG